MQQFKATTVPVIVGALGIIKKETDKHTNRIPCCLSQYKTQKKEMLIAELLIFLGD